jgi:hypothetical protein
MINNITTKLHAMGSGLEKINLEKDILTKKKGLVDISTRLEAQRSQSFGSSV